MRSTCSAKVYPRGCGGTDPKETKPYSLKGLSPRMRGNQGARPLQVNALRSIPAGAGEPLPASVPRRRAEVYPRGCGGTRLSRSTAVAVSGLSPRVRGNRVGSDHPDERPGSIPAGAGEPIRQGRRGICSEVYPRGCGGTPGGPAASQSCRGLSPRVRGNPRKERVCRGCSWVYPRGCGGTQSIEKYGVIEPGLSPRVRGNPVPCRDPGLVDGSIPAGAGEPFSIHRSAASLEVYPRGCGGTASAKRLMQSS